MAERNPTAVRDLSRHISTSLSQNLLVAQALDHPEDIRAVYRSVLRSLLAMCAASRVVENMHGKPSDDTLDSLALAYAALDEVAAGIASTDPCSPDKARELLTRDMHAMLRRHISALPIGPEQTKLLQFAVGLACGALSGTMEALTGEKVGIHVAAQIVANNLTAAYTKHGEQSNAD